MESKKRFSITFEVETYRALTEEFANFIKNRLTDALKDTPLSVPKDSKFTFPTMTYERLKRPGKLGKYQLYARPENKVFKMDS